MHKANNNKQKSPFLENKSSSSTNRINVRNEDGDGVAPALTFRARIVATITIRSKHENTFTALAQLPRVLGNNLCDFQRSFHFERKEKKFARSTKKFS